MKQRTWFTRVLAALVAVGPTPVAAADPCGMVPPIAIAGLTRPIARVGEQITYVFHKDGIESIVLRPGFEGKVEEFGMLIPFPSPPAIRKVSDDIFPHVAAAVDPPPVVVNIAKVYRGPGDSVGSGPSTPGPTSGGSALGLRYDEVKVIREEAVGMYEVAVLAAGGARALARWMTDHGFRYPDGMDSVCDEYVADGWCFVAVKARVGNKAATDPKPGMRDVDPSLPPGASFDGHVQAMGFRFRTDELVVPMRLSAFNEGELYNVVYVLTDGPVRATNLDEELVLQQIRGSELLRNVTEALPLVVRGGTEAQIPAGMRAGLVARRNPVPHNGLARDLFASDLLASRTGVLANPFEEREKRLLEVGEALGLRGADLDDLHRDALAAEVEESTKSALRDLRYMTLSVIEGDFPREAIAAANLTFERFKMPSRLNTLERYRERERPGDKHGWGVPDIGPPGGRPGPIGPRPGPPGPGSPGPRRGLLVVALFALGLSIAALGRRRRIGVALATAAAFLVLAAPPARAQELRTNVEWIERLVDPAARPAAVAALTARGEDAVADLVRAAKRASDLPTRGWAIVMLGRVGGAKAERELARLQRTSSEHELVRTWAASARVALIDDAEELAELSRDTIPFPAVVRPLAARWNALLAAGADRDTIEELLDVCDRNTRLEEELLPLLLGLGPDELVPAVYRAPTDRQRRRCAAYVATLAQTERRGDVAAAVLASMKFDPLAVAVPWKGGALYVPSVPWRPVEANQLIRELFAWLVMCEREELDIEARQVRNNLASVGLFAVAGLERDAMGGHKVEDRLYHWGLAVGIEPVRALLAEQGLEDVQPFQRTLEALGR